MVKFDRYKCLRTDYFHNRCNICKDISPQAVSFKNQITIDESQLDINVISQCPTEAFSSDDFDATDFAFKFIASDEKSLKDHDTTPLESLTPFHFAAIALRKDDFSVSTTQEIVIQKVTQANQMLQEFGFEKTIEIKGPIDRNRREFFTKVIKEIKQKDLETSHIYSYESRIPRGLQFLKNALKLQTKELENTLVQSSFFVSKTIEKSCDNCSECVQFCPTDALFYDQDRVKIHFLQSSCINCGICNDICHLGAVQNSDKIDLIELSFEKPKMLIAHNLIACQRCKTPFPQKEDETVCKVCGQFEDENMFALASQV